MKQKQDAMFTCRINKDVLQKFKLLADLKGISYQAILKTLIKDYINNEQRKLEE